MRQNQGADQDTLVGRLTHEPGTCFVVIAMRNMFVEGELPGETPSKSAGSDISSFTDLYQNALDVYGKCSNPKVNEPGWYPAGWPPTSFNQIVSLVSFCFGFTDWVIQVT